MTNASAPVHATARSLASVADDTAALTLEAPTRESFAQLARLTSLHTLSLSSAKLTDEVFSALASLPSLRALSLSSCTGAPERALTELLRASPLEAFSVTWCHELGTAAARCAASSPALRSFSYFGGPPLDDAHVTALAALPALETLHVPTARGVTDAGVSALASAPALAHLTLHDSAVTGSTLPSLVRLRSLSVRGADLDPRWPRTLGALRALAHLGVERLDEGDTAALASLPELSSVQLLAAHTMSPAELRALARLPKLERLRCPLATTLDDDALAHIAAHCALRELNVAHCSSLTGACFSDSARWAQLESLDVSHSKLGDGAIARIAALPRLARLVLHNVAAVTTAGLSHLTRAPALRELDLYSAPIDDALLAQLAGRLEALTLTGSHRVTARAVRAAASSHPSLRVAGDGFLDADASVAAAESYPAAWNGAPLLSLDGSCIGLVNHAGVVTTLKRPGGAKLGKKTLRGPLALAPDAGRALLLGTKHKLVTVATGAELPSPALKHRRVDAGAFSPDATLVALAGIAGTTKKPTRALTVWQAGGDRVVAQHALPGDSDERLGVALSPNKSQALMWGARLDHVVLATGAVTALCEEPVGAAAFTDDGGVAYVCGEDDALALVRLDAGLRETARTDLAALLDAAPRLVLRCALDRIDADPKSAAPAGDTYVETLCCGPDGPLVLLRRGGFDLALVLGDRARWLHVDSVGTPHAALTPRSIALSYERPDAARSVAVSVWAIDALRALFDDAP